MYLELTTAINNWIEENLGYIKKLRLDRLKDGNPCNFIVAKLLSSRILIQK